jgi:hypothetical protein
VKFWGRLTDLERANFILACAVGIATVVNVVATVIYVCTFISSSGAATKQTAQLICAANLQVEAANKMVAAAQTQAQKMIELATQAKNQTDSTKDIAKGTVSQARATNRLAHSAEISNGNALNADRPWVGIGLSVENFEVDKEPRATIIFSNSGRRPARITNAQYRWRVYTPIFPENPEYPTEGTEGSTNIVIPNSNSSAIFTIDKITAEQMEIFRRGLFYIYAKVEYDDPATQEHHWTHACWRYTYFEKGVRSGFYNCGTYNEAQ